MGQARARARQLRERAPRAGAEGDGGGSPRLLRVGLPGGGEKRGLSDVPPFEDVREEIREVVRELKLNAEIERWTAQLRSETRVLIYRR